MEFAANSRIASFILVLANNYQIMFAFDPFHRWILSVKKTVENVKKSTNRFYHPKTRLQWMRVRSAHIAFKSADISLHCDIYAYRLTPANGIRFVGV